MDKWASTRKSYVDWLSDSELREEFSKKIILRIYPSGG